ncbi:MAG TPA: DUF6518 family protein [Acidimicrobiales bacterium]|nr:DUF6518 family protein [Acidimicrobiales bacterium]
MKRTVAVAVLLLCVSAVFGAADQYVGSLSSHPWGAYVSGLSAPWLLLPFLVGVTQRTPRAAVVMGAASTFVALMGYCLMTLSPIENAQLNVASVLAFLRAGNYRWFVAGAATGPLFGRGGWAWRHGRVWWAAVAVGAFYLEPVFHLVLGSPIQVPAVWQGEVLLGLVATAFLTYWVRNRAVPLSRG